MLDRFSVWVDKQTAKSSAFIFACVMVLVWAAAGPLFEFSETWQLAINTATTIVTFLMVFLLQNSQSRQTARHYALTQKIEALEEKLLQIVGGDDGSN